jgi:hypothetical protein
VKIYSKNPKKIDIYCSIGMQKYNLSPVQNMAEYKKKMATHKSRRTNFNCTICGLSSNFIERFLSFLTSHLNFGSEPIFANLHKCVKPKRGTNSIETCSSFC